MFVTKISNDLQVTPPNIGTGFTGPFSIATEYIVGGYYDSGDGGGGIFVWIEPSGSAPFPADDGGIIIYNANKTDGYFKRIYSGPINVRWFGAKGDGLTDDTAAVDAARDSGFTRDGGTIYFPKGTYRGAFQFLSVHGEIHLIGDGAGSVCVEVIAICLATHVA